MMAKASTLSTGQWKNLLMLHDEAKTSGVSIYERCQVQQQYKSLGNPATGIKGIQSSAEPGRSSDESPSLMSPYLAYAY